MAETVNTGTNLTVVFVLGGVLVALALAALAVYLLTRGPDDRGED
jgi:hypothetical protein